MSIIQRRWTPEQADEWTKEDWMAIVLSPLAYMLITVGVAMAIMLRPVGFILLVAGGVITVVMHLIIDPKLKVISAEYEKNQKRYLEELDRRVRWEKSA
ncbi:MAG: hypothetical protein JSW54_08310 [Fidelibacterota bacterium]|nr:MAG: hypothetical protein JSW54_08310 [Candidatus Neomarinimicrobiota bacterium]